MCWDTHHTIARRVKRRAFTLTEVVMVLVMVSLLILLLAPSLNAAAGRGETQVCLDNLRSLGVAVRLYAEDCGTLPGPLHPAVWHGMLRDDDNPVYQYIRDRTLAWKLRVALGESITDRLITCPVMNRINPDDNFRDFYETTGKLAYPTHYAINSYGSLANNPTRATNPRDYFGYSDVLPNRNRSPVAFGAVANADREWMIADAWYRPRVFATIAELQQEGPYQYSWTGEALPNFAPHELSGARAYRFTDSDTRRSQSSAIRQSKSDGITNTLFFDGHAAAAPSRTYMVGTFEILYGFPGTVNPAQISPPPGSIYWLGIWR